jgi:ribokinase
MGKVLVVGSINKDITLTIKRLPKVGETILSSGTHYANGGKGANQAVALGKLGADVSFFGKVGSDSFGEEMLQSLEQSGVDTTLCLRDREASSGLALILLNEDGDNSIVVSSGANFAICEEELTVLEDFIKGVDFCVLQLEIPVNIVNRVLSLCKMHEVCTILNPAPVVENINDLLFDKIDYLIPNEHELEALVTEEALSIDKKCQNLLNRGVKNVIVTLGEKGSCLYQGANKIEYFSAYKVDAVDTTAAGDSFIGAFVYMLAKGKNEAEAIAFAAKVSAITVTRQGAQISIPSIEEVEKFIG